MRFHHSRAIICYFTDFANYLTRDIVHIYTCCMHHLINIPRYRGICCLVVNICDPSPLGVWVPDVSWIYMCGRYQLPFRTLDVLPRCPLMHEKLPRGASWVFLHHERAGAVIWPKLLSVPIKIQLNWNTASFNHARAITPLLLLCKLGLVEIVDGLHTMM